MKKIFYIFIILFSCDDYFGVEEFEESFTYYDFLAYGWANVFDNNSDLAFYYFDQALTQDVDYYNNAIVGMGWAMTYEANSLLYAALCDDDSENCTQEVDLYRNKAKCYFYRSTEEDLDELNSAQILEWCEDENTNIDVLYDELDIMTLDFVQITDYFETACLEDENGDFEFISCFENFAADLKVAHIYLEYLSYAQSILDDEIDDTPATDVISLFEEFISDYSTYDIMSDKSNYNFDYMLTYKNIAARISQLYLSINQYEAACENAVLYSICDDLECSGDILSLIDCLSVIFD